MSDVKGFQIFYTKRRGIIIKFGLCVIDSKIEKVFLLNFGGEYGVGYAPLNLLSFYVCDRL